MCLQCTAEAKKVIDIFPGYALYVSTVDAPGWPADAFGLVRQNDPDVIWCAGLTLLPQDDDESDNSAELAKWHFLAVSGIENNFSGGMFASYLFVKACVEAGYNPDEHGTRVVSWFVDYAAKKLAEVGYYG